MKRSAEKLQKDADAVERAICESSMYSMGADDALANQPNWQSACKNESRNCSRFQAEVCRLRAALKKIEEFGHGHGHGRGYTCANMAAEALGTDER